MDFFLSYASVGRDGVIKLWTPFTNITPLMRHTEKSLPDHQASSSSASNGNVPFTFPLSVVGEIDLRQSVRMPVGGDGVSTARIKSSVSNHHRVNGMHPYHPKTSMTINSQILQWSTPATWMPGKENSEKNLFFLESRLLAVGTSADSAIVFFDILNGKSSSSSSGGKDDWNRLASNKGSGGVPLKRLEGFYETLGTSRHHSCPIGFASKLSGSTGPGNNELLIAGHSSGHISVYCFHARNWFAGGDSDVIGTARVRIPQSTANSNSRSQMSSEVISRERSTPSTSPRKINRSSPTAERIPKLNLGNVRFGYLFFSLRSVTADDFRLLAILVFLLFVLVFTNHG
jgi:hypothetical protein